MHSDGGLKGFHLPAFGYLSVFYAESRLLRCPFLLV